MRCGGGGRWIRFWILVRLRRRVEACEEWDFGVEQGGRVSLIWGLNGDVALPHGVVMRSDLLLKGNGCMSRRMLDVI